MARVATVQRKVRQVVTLYRPPGITLEIPVVTLREALGSVIELDHAFWFPVQLLNPDGSSIELELSLSGAQFFPGRPRQWAAVLSPRDGSSQDIYTVQFHDYQLESVEHVRSDQYM